MSWYEPPSDRDAELADDEWRQAYEIALEDGMTEGDAETAADRARRTWWRENVIERGPAPREYDPTEGFDQ